MRLKNIPPSFFKTQKKKKKKIANEQSFSKPTSKRIKE